MDIVRIGIVGVGGMGNGHARNMPKIHEVRLTAVCDVSAQALQAAMNDYEVPGFETADDGSEAGIPSASCRSTLLM